MPFRVIRISLYLLVCIFFCPLYCFSQKSESYNINIYNGLPSNNVYALVVDHNGYLWISTDQGVARYDGHKLKVYDLTKGFINKDIWSLTEDNKGRIWLYSISDNFGFIHQNRYKHIFNPFPVNYIYPRYDVTSYAGGVCFTSHTIYRNTNSARLSFCVERNDSLIFSYDISRFGFIANIIDEHHLVTLDASGMVHALNVAGNEISAIQLGRVIMDTAYTDLVKLMREMNAARSFTFDKYIISYSVNQDFLNVINTSNLIHKKISLSSLINNKTNEKISMVTLGPGVVNVITEQHIYKLNVDLNLTKQYTIDSFQQGMKGSQINYFIDDPFWGGIVATYNNGIYFRNNNKYHWKAGLFDLTDFNFLGNVSAGESYWWSKSAKIFTRIKNHLDILSKHMDLYNPAKIIPYSKDTSLLLSQLNIQKVDNKSLSLVDFRLGNNGLDGIVTKDNILYAISKTAGFYRLSLDDSPLHFTIENDRFNGMAYDSVRDAFWVFNNSKVLVYKDGFLPLTLSSSFLGGIGVNRIGKILLDSKFGNVFIQEDGRLLHFTDVRNSYTSLFRNYALNDAKVALRGNNLVVAGKFGILFSRVSGPGKLSDPVVLPNSKRIQYSNVYELELSNNEALLKTDKGTFVIPIPALGSFKEEKSTFLAYKLLLGYNNELFDLAKGDTINLQKNNYKLHFNLIKPSGDGNVKYCYKLDGISDSWRDLNDNELNLPLLAAGNYYKLSVRVSDDQWRSDVINMNLYVVPYWWETTQGQRLLWLISLAFIALIVYVIVGVTKRIVTKNHEKKNLQLELELKSVYSQINPHFIFNTLGVALYLVKTKKLEEAYQHIHKFSNLLRSYIKSSRNRFILLGEEIVNLRNYIDLQQARFNDKFNYEIIVEQHQLAGMHIPSLLLQPIVENAISHGLLHKEHDGHLKIIFRQGQADKEIICIIDDDGVGRQHSKLIKDEYVVKDESYGNVLIKDLIAVFNRYETMEIELEYIDKVEPLTGTIVKLRIKDLS